MLGQYCFDDKEDLFAAVMLDVIRNWLSTLGEFPEVDSADAFWETFEDILRRSMGMWREDPYLADFSRNFQQMRRSGGMAPALREVMATGTTWAVDLLAKGHAAGAVRSDLSLDLLGELAMALDTVMDGWLAERRDELTQPEHEFMFPGTHDLFRRVCLPAANGGHGGATREKPARRS